MVMGPALAVGRRKELRGEKSMTRSRRVVTLRGFGVLALIVLAAALLPATFRLVAHADGTAPVVFTGPATVSWHSDAMTPGTNANNTNGDNCFDSTGKPFSPPNLTGPNACEVLTLTATVPPSHSPSQPARLTFHPSAATNDYTFY